MLTNTLTGLDFVILIFYGFSLRHTSVSSNQKETAVLYGWGSVSAIAARVHMSWGC